MTARPPPPADSKRTGPPAGGPVAFPPECRPAVRLPAVGLAQAGTRMAARARRPSCRGVRADAGSAKVLYTGRPMRAPFPSVLRAALPVAALASLGLAPVWDRLPPGIPADSLEPALRALESRSPKPLAASAAFALGQFHHARGEYRAAADVFGRSAARLTGGERAEARYGQGLAYLGAGEAGRARAAFEEVVTHSAALRPLAQLGLARAHALAGDTAREFDELGRLLEGPAGEAEPAALERWAALCDQLGRAEEAASARDRLLRRWPRSFEAARLGRPAPPLAP